MNPNLGRPLSGRSIRCLVADGISLPFGDNCFANIVTLETVEHVIHHRDFLQELSRVLHADGLCILSTPNRTYSLRRGIANPYHVREFDADDLRELLRDYFDSVVIYFQGLSSSYHSRVAQYAESVQQRKSTLSLPKRFVIDHIYHRAKCLVPARLTNLFIRSILGLSFPQPQPDDILFSFDLVQECNVLIAACRQPR